MGHFTAKAERMGIDVQKESEHISFNGERYLTKDVEQQLAQNFERSIEARLEYARQLGANTDTETVRGATDRNIKPDQAELFEVHSLDHLSYRAEAMGIPVEIGEQYVNIDGQQFAKQDLEENFDRNKSENLARRQEYGEEELFRAQSMEDFRNTAEQLAWPMAEDEKNVTVNGETYPKEELEEVFAANKQQFHESLREWEPLLREARSMEELETKAQEAGVECRVEGGDLPSVHLNGESYRLETIADILKENLQGPAQQQKNEVEVEIKPEMEDLFRAQSMAQFVDHCRSQGLVVERDESSVSIGGARYDKKELEAVFDANIAENREAVRQGEPLLQGAQTMMELEQAARKAKVEFSVSNSDPDREVVRLNGNTYEKHDIDVILSDNARPEALTLAKDQMLDSPEQLLKGRGLNCENLEHLQRLAEKMGIEVKIEKDLIQTRETGESGQFQLFDRRAVEDIFNQKQMIRLSEIRQQVPLLDKIQSYKEFEELAQKTGTGYEAVQRTEHELALRQGKESLRQGKSDLKEGREKAEAGQILRDEGTERAKLGQQTLDAAREGTRLGSLSKSVREAQRSVREGWEAAAAGHTLIKQGESQAGQGLELIAGGKKTVTDAQAAIQKARQEPLEKPVEKKAESAGVPEKAPSLFERIREQTPLLAGAVREKFGRGASETPATAYRINKETMHIVVGGKKGPTTLQRKDLQEIFAQNRKTSLLSVYEKRQDSRILREARNMGEFRRIAERLEIKYEDKGRSIEMKGQEYRKSDLQQIFQLNAQNPSNQREEWFDHRAGQAQNKMNSEVKTTDEEQTRKSGARHGMVSEQTQKARKSSEDKPKQKRRKNGKKIPDFRQKIEKQERYRRQGQKI